MGEDDTKVAVEPSANGTCSLQKAPDAEAQGGEETHELKKDEDAGPEKMEIDAEIKQHEEKDKKLETEKTDDKADQMDEDNKVKADDGVSGEEDTVMKENMESDDKKDIKEGAGNQGMAKVDTTQERTEKESEDGGKLNGDKQGNKEDIKEEDKVVSGDKWDSVDEGENNKDEEPKENNEIQLAEDGKEKETNKQEEEEEEHVEADAEPKVEDEKAESKGGNENEIDESKDEKEDEKEETMDDKEDEKEESNHDKNEDTNKSNKRGKGKTDKVRGKTKSEEDKKDIEPRTPFSDRPVRERKSVERLVALVDKDSSKEFQVAKGKGTPLKDIPNVAYKLSRKKSDEVLKLLHTILFGGRRGKAAQIRTNILRFSGYTWQGDEEKAKDKAKEKLDKCNKEKLLEFCDIFDISVAKTTRKKEDIVAKLFEFLEKPHATTDVLIYEKEKGAKRKRTPKKSSPAAGSSSSKRSAKSQKKTEEATKTNKKSLPHSDDESEEEKEEEEKEEEEEEKEQEAEEKEETIEEEENENGIPDKSEDEVPQPSESEEKAESEEESEEETKKKKRGSRTSSGKKESAGKSRSKKTAVSMKSSPAKKATQKRSASKRKKSDDDSDTTPKASSKRKKTENPSKEQSLTPSKSAAKEKSGKRGGKGKDNTKKPSDEELKNAILDILKGVDFSTATFTDILKRLAAKFDIDLTSKKSSIKLMIQDELTKIAEADDEERDEEDPEKEEARGSVGGEEVKPDHKAHKSTLATV